MNKNILVVAYVFLIISMISCKQDKERDKSIQPPNIILIVADDLGYSDLSCYGSPLIETPNLDRLAAIGMKFTHGYAAAPLCSPTRASIVTGLNPARINLTEHIHGHHPTPSNQKLVTPKTAQSLDTNLMTIPEVLSNVGYITAHIGKWHLGGGKASPQYQGYDHAYAGSWAGLPGSFFYPFFNGGAYPELKEEAQEGDYLTDVLTDHALQWMDQHRDTTFFISLNFYAPHVPIEGKDSLVQYYIEKAKRLNIDLPNPHYAAMVASIDENVGRIMNFIGHEDLSNTLVVFTSDNGGLDVEEVPAFAKHTPPTTNAPLRAGKGYIYEGGIREPFIFYHPSKVMKGKVSDKMVSTTDLLNTFASVAGSSYRSEDGIDISATLQKNETSRDAYFLHFPHYSPQRGKPGGVIRKGNFKLIEWYETNQLELFDLEKDPGELDNLAANNPEKVKELSEQFLAWKKSINAQEVTLNEAYNEN